MGLLKKIFFLFVLCSPDLLQAQKNALGLAPDFSYFDNKTWDRLQDTYQQTFDTLKHKHPYLHYLPGISLAYERQLAEYIYVQPFLQYQRATTSSSNDGNVLKLKVQFLSAGANLNWYPAKMAHGQKKSMLNPFYVRVSLGATYALNSIQLNGKAVYDDSTHTERNANLAIFADAGFGYDLHFGRLVVQPFIGARLYPGMYMQSMGYFIDASKQYDQEDTGFGWAARIQVSLLYLF